MPALPCFDDKARDVRRMAAVFAAAAAVTVSVLICPSVAEAWTPPVPSLVSQVPFEIAGSPSNVGSSISVDTYIYGITSTVDASDFITWALCDDGSGATRIPVTASVDRPSRTLTLQLAVEVNASSQRCVLNTLSNALDSHVAFYPQRSNPRVDSYFLEGEFIVDGIVVS